MATMAIHANGPGQQHAFKSISRGLLLGLICFVGLAGLAQAYLPKPEAMRLCRIRSGLVDSDLSEYKTRNEG